MQNEIKLERIEISDEKRNTTVERMIKDKEKEEELKKSIEEDLSKKYLSSNQKSYKVHKYADNCEEHNQISFVLPLIRSTPKFVLYIILNIFTVGLINLFIAWFPKLNLYLYYKVTDFDMATHFGVFSKDNELLVVKKKEISFPEIENEEKSVIKKFNLNINYKEKKAIMFEYKLFDYIYIAEKDEFTSIDYKIKDKQVNIIEEYSTGLNPNEIELMRSLFGICDIDIRVSSIGKILLEELTDPFYLFQVYSIFLWYFTEYVYYATVIVVLTIISLIISVHGTYKNLKQLQKISHYSCPVKVFRKNEKNEYMDPIEVSSTELVPGDLFEIPEDGLALPCDAILIDGSVIINESMLTGESTPVIKVRMSGTDNIFNTKEADSDKYILFGGTKVVQKRKIGNGPPLGIAFQTGFKTFKGNLINAILYPKSENDDFTKDSVKYIIFMGILCIIGFSISLKFLITEGELSDKEIVEKFLDLFTTAVPPSLPACISVGITYSLSRLKKKGIFCIQRDHVNRAGTVNILIFDKTGTLTEDHLDISGYVSVKLNEENQFEFLPFTSDIKHNCSIILEHFKKKLSDQNYKNKNKDLLQYYTECSACCHCLTYVKEKLVGDPIDVKMFEALGWIMKENDSNEGGRNLDPLVVLNYIRPNTEEDIEIRLQNNEANIENLKGKYALGIVKRFDFSSKLQRMTTISKNINENYFKAFCKGSPEKVKDLCKPDTIPINYDSVLNSYTIKGYRVLAMAAKGLKMDFHQSQSISREDVEKNMIFLGFLIVKNKLKEKTKESLTKYDEADLRMLMATGDNILTAICVSKECSLIKRNQEMFTCDLEKNQNGKEILKWRRIEGNDEDTDGSSDGELNISSGQYTKRGDQDNIVNITSDTNISLDELFPPENVSSDYKPKIIM